MFAQWKFKVSKEIKQNIKKCLKFRNNTGCVIKISLAGAGFPPHFDPRDAGDSFKTDGGSTLRSLLEELQL